MVVDWVRGCYRSRWRLFRDSDVETPGRYYFAAPGSQHFPGYHNFGSALWNPTDPKTIQGLGEVVTARRQHYNGQWDSIYPQSRYSGDLDCFANGERIANAVDPSTLYHGYPAVCFLPLVASVPPQPPLPESNWGRASAFQERGTQVLWARIIEAMYADDAPTITAILTEFFTDSPTITFHPAVGDMPAVTTVIGADYAFAVVDGTRNAQQLASQAFQGIQGPTDFGAVETIPLWYSASNHVHMHLVNDGANLIGNVMVIGHSYGAAAALILAARYRFAQPSRPIKFLTFGAPKPGGVKVEELLRRIDGTSIANDNDVITALPPDRVTMAAISVLFPLTSFAPWFPWERSPATSTLDGDGVLTPGANALLDFETLFRLVQRAVLNQEQDSILGHSIGEYLRRLLLEQEVATWPMTEAVLALVDDEQETETGVGAGSDIAGQGFGETQVRVFFNEPEPIGELGFGVGTVTLTSYINLLKGG